jgi:hypothetical protein
LTCAADHPELRPGQPAALQRQRQQTPDFETLFKRFAGYYDALGKPKVVLLWNRQLSAQLVDRKEMSLKAESTAEASSTQHEDDTAGRTGASRLKELSALDKQTTTITATERLVADEGARRDPRERDFWTIQSSFSKTLTRAGVRFVDRTTAMRIEQAKAFDLTTTATPNSRILEMKALAKHADMLCGILLTEDSLSAVHIGFHTRCTNLKTGQELVSLYSVGDRKHTPDLGYRVGEQGYEKVAAAPPDLGEIGFNLALDLMQEMVGEGKQ